MVQRAIFFRRLQSTFVAIVVVAAAWIGLPYTAQAETFVVALNHAPPYRIIKKADGDERFSGFYIDFIREVARRFNISLVFKEVPFKRALYLMERGSADIMVGPNRTADREVYMLYLDEELSRERKVLFLGAGIPDITKYKDLETKRIGVLRSAAYFDRFDQDSNLIKSNIKNYLTALKMVSKGRLDTAIMPELLGDYLIKKSGINLKKATLTVEGRPSFIAISRKSSLAQSKSLLEAVLREMKADGTIDKIIGHYR